MTEPLPGPMTAMALLVDEDQPVTILQERRVTFPSGLTIGSLDAGGVSWYLEQLVGWDGAPSTGDMQQRLYRHGAWSNRAYLAPRILQVQGHATGRQSALYRAADRLMASIPLAEPELVTVAEGATQRIVGARQHDDPLVELGPGWFRFDIALQCPDPRRLSGNEFAQTARLPSSVGGLTLPTTVPFPIAAVVTDNTVTIVNDGNIEAPARLRITGPVQAPRVRHAEQGRELLFGINLSAGQFLDVDLDEHTVLLNGTANRRGVVVGQWFTLPPGAQELAFDAAAFDAAATCVVTWRSAWR